MQTRHSISEEEDDYKERWLKRGGGGLEVRTESRQGALPTVCAKHEG